MKILRQKEFATSTRAIKAAKSAIGQIAIDFGKGNPRGNLDAETMRGLRKHKREKGGTIIVSEGHSLVPIEHETKPHTKKYPVDPNQTELDLKFEPWKRTKPIQKQKRSRRPSHMYNDVTKSEGLEWIKPIYSEGSYKTNVFEGPQSYIQFK